MPKVHKSASQRRLRPKNSGAAVKAPGPQSDILTLREVAHWLRVNPNTVYRMVARKQLPAFRFGKDFRFVRSEILSGMARLRRPGDGPQYGRTPKAKQTTTAASTQTSMDFDAWISG